MFLVRRNAMRNTLFITGILLLLLGFYIHDRFGAVEYMEFRLDEVAWGSSIVIMAIVAALDIKNKFFGHQDQK